MSTGGRGAAPWWRANNGEQETGAFGSVIGCFRGFALRHGVEEDAGGPVTITYLTWYTQGEEDELLNRFMDENPGITVQVEAVDGTRYGEILKLRMTAGDLPDVITCKLWT